MPYLYLNATGRHHARPAPDATRVASPTAGRKNVWWATTGPIQPPGGGSVGQRVLSQIFTSEFLNNHNHQMKTWAKTLRELAAAVESDHSTLIAWREKGCPIKETGRGYYIPKVRKWIEENPRRRKEAKLTSTKMRDRQELADVRVKEARAKKAELEYEIKLGKFMELEKVKQRDLARIRAVKDGLMSLPKTLAPIVVEGFADQFQAEAVLEKKVTELLEKFSSM